MVCSYQKSPWVFLATVLCLAVSGFAEAGHRSECQEKGVGTPAIAKEASAGAIPSAQHEFSQLRRELAAGQSWDDLLQQVAAIVDRNRMDPTARLQALELLAEAGRDTTDRIVRVNGKAWAEFCLQYATELSAVPYVNGKSDLQVPFRFTSVLKSLTRTLGRLDPTATARLELQMGQIGRNLHANAAYPRQAVAGLAPLLLEEARGHARNLDGDSAHRSIQTALEWGLVDFEEVFDDSTLIDSASGERIRRIVGERQEAYVRQVGEEVSAAIAGFRPFPFQFSLPGLDGGRRNKTHYSGKLTVVDIWGTWCKPCRASIPHLLRLQSEFGGRGVQIVGIAMEQEPAVAEIQARLREFASLEGITYELLVGNDQVLEQIPGGSVLPTLLFLDESGRVRFSTSGYRDYTQIRSIVTHLLENPIGPSR